MPRAVGAGQISQPDLSVMLTRAQAFLEQTLAQHRARTISEASGSPVRLIAASFTRPAPALAAALALREGFSPATGPSSARRQDGPVLDGLGIRIALHTGPADGLTDPPGEQTLAYARQLLRVARAGQVFLSETAFQSAGDILPPGMRITAIGRMNPRDGTAPLPVYEVLPTDRDRLGTADGPARPDPEPATPARRPRTPATPKPRAGATPAPFRITTLGRFQIERGGQPVELSGSQGLKGLQLFKCLLSRPGRRLPRDQAYELFWPDSPRNKVDTTFRTGIKRLRDVLEPDVDARLSIVAYTQDAVSIRREPEVWLDADEFERLIAEARQAAQPEPLLEAADRLYQGEYLPDDLYQDWSIPRRDELRRLWTELQFELSAMREQRGDEQAAAVALQRLLTVDPTDERATRELMLLFARHGRRSEALKAYQRLEEALLRDLDMEPSPEIQAARQQVTAGQVERSPTPPPAPGTSPGPSSVAAGQDVQLLVDSPAVSPGRIAFTPTYPFPRPDTLVGRQAMLAAARQALQRGLSAGHTVLIGAAAGAGKSALAGMLVAEAQAMGFLCLAGGSFDQDSPSPYAPIRDALCDYLLAQPPADLRASLGDLVTDLAPMVPELRYHAGLPTGAQPSGPSRAADPSQLLAAVHGCLRVLAMHGPTLLCLEDLHAADGATLEMLQYLSRQTRRLRLVIVATYRPEEVESGRPLARLLSAARRDGTAQELHLPPLRRDETQALIAARLGGTVSETLTDELFAVTEGNPLFIEQLILGLLDEERIVQRDGIWYLIGPENTAVPSLPPVVESVIERRFDRLPPGGRDTLAMAAVLGQTFDVQTLVAAMSQAGAADTAADVAAVVAVLDGAISAQLVRETSTGYRFGHAMIREALYRRLSGPRRASLHARAGEIIERLAGERADDRAAELAYHFALAASVAPTAQKALRFSLDAGRRAAALSAHREALRHFTRACDVLDLHGSSDDAALRLDVLQGRGTAEQDLGLWQSAIQTFRQVLSLTDDPYRRAHAHSIIGRGLEQVTDMSSALMAYDAALADLAPVAGEPAAERMRLALLYDKAFPYLLQGRFASALEAGQHILDAGIQTGQSALLFRGHCMVALSRMWTGRVDEAISHYTHALESVQLGGNKIQIATAHENYGTQLYLCGRLMDARLHIEQAAAFYRDAAGERRTVLACQRLSRIHLALGDLPHALEQAERGRLLALEVGDRHVAECNAALGAVHAARAAWADAIICYQRALEVQQRVGHLVSTTDSLLGLGLVHERQGHWHQAEELYRHAVAVASTMDPGIRTVAASRQLGRLQLRRGDRTAAMETLSRALLLAEQMPATLELAPTLLARAELRWQDDLAAAIVDAERARTAPMTADVAVEAGALLVALYLDAGRLDAAAEALQVMRSVAVGLGTPFWLGLARLATGRLAAAQGNHETARQELAAAVDLFMQSGTPYERASSLRDLADTLEQSRQDPAHAALLRTEAAGLLHALGIYPLGQSVAGPSASHAQPAGGVNTEAVPATGQPVRPPQALTEG
ncbi:MAG: tetratricopeptide repeat protein [Chloroflexota bacterium]